ncbi:hypothetical protein [Streptomyces cadmiisoli]|uniref:hypothetical protein n=1 Tax=Streptomyces cadmiisoli TaxID=2184053 RepID=UPI003D70E770
MLISLVYLRPPLPHAALAETYELTRPTVTRAIHEIRPAPARRRFADPQRPGARLHTPARGAGPLRLPSRAPTAIAAT